MRSFLLCAAILLPAAAATAQSGPSGRRDDERVCRAVGEAGSRLAARRVCKTRAEWAADARVARESVDGAQTRQVSPTADELVRAPTPR